MVICPDCGKEVPNDKFCKNCGAYLPKIEEISVESTSVEPNIAPESEDVKSGVNYCRNCGFKLEGDFKFCPNCGCNLKAPVKSKNVSLDKEKNTLLAVVLSVLLPGMGHMFWGLDDTGAVLLIENSHKTPSSVGDADASHTWNLMDLLSPWLPKRGIFGTSKSSFLRP